MSSRIYAGVLLLLLGSNQTAMAAESPQAFLQRLYSAYAPHGKGNDFAYPDARAIVDDTLLALLHHDRIKSKGEVGALDFDPICQCQDWESFKVLSLHANLNGPAHASADVTFKPDPEATEKVHFDLVLVSGAWKIHDMSWHDTPSLQAYLRDYKY